MTAESFLYATPNCSGTQYSGGYYGVNTPSNSDFALSALLPLPDDGTVNAYYARPSELQAQQYYNLNEFGADNAADATTQCMTATTGCPDAGMVVGTAHPCANPRPPSFVTCVSCCRPDTTRTKKEPSCTLNPSEQQAPVHSFTVNSLGFSPPFRLQP